MKLSFAPAVDKAAGTFAAETAVSEFCGAAGGEVGEMTLRGFGEGGGMEAPTAAVAAPLPLPAIWRAARALS